MTYTAERAEDTATIEPVGLVPLENPDSEESAICPNCRVNWLDHAYTQNYCDNCGQKLDWSGYFGVDKK